MNFSIFYVRNQENSLADYFCYYVQHQEAIDVDLLFGLIGKPVDYTPKLNYYREVGPKVSMVTPWCSNALAIFRKCCPDKPNMVKRIERSELIPFDQLENYQVDPMTQSVYDEPLRGFPENSPQEDLYDVEDIEMENINKSLGFDVQDNAYYMELFEGKLKRNPTNVELYDLAQSNSEHSRHWFFRGVLFDPLGNRIEKSLFKMIKETQNNTSDRNVIAFSDNASAIFGFEVPILTPDVNRQMAYTKKKELLHLTLTAETHNFPTGIAPFPGAATGTGGRIRDTHAIGRGGYVVAGLAGYCVGSLTESDFIKKNETTLIRASDGASDYGNKFGEPVILGFCRDYGLDVNNERIEWIKPIMFSAGMGMMYDRDQKKSPPEVGMSVVKIGGPCYRIGIGGGAASSRDQDTKNIEEDLSAVQRGDPEMENKLNRLIRTCIENNMNPITSIHDQGAGGTANVTKEIVYPTGAHINLDHIEMGDNSLNSLEKWISEYQEQDTILVKDQDVGLIQAIGQRENIGVSVIGKIEDTGKIIVESNGKTIVDLPLEETVGDSMKMKEYHLVKSDRFPQPVRLPYETTIKRIERVFRLSSVGSKRFLTNKVDRSVTGLIAQQQCVGPNGTPLSNFGIISQSFFDTKGGVTAIGERPNIGQVDSAKMARMAVAEMLTNMMFANVTKLEDIRCSGNWMWPLKIKGEKLELYHACKAMCDIINTLGIALDGGKDSLSMVYKDNDRIIVGPRQLVITGYAPTEDINLKVTPDFKKEGSTVLWVDLSCGRKRLGGSCLYQVYNKIGSNCPDVGDVDLLGEVFNKVQFMVGRKMILAGHDISDGGLITALCEMAFAGNLGVEVNLPNPNHYNSDHILFSEELGFLLEVDNQYTDAIINLIGPSICYNIGTTTSLNYISIKIGSVDILSARMTHLRSLWERTSFMMELKQTTPELARSENESLDTMYHLTYKYEGSNVFQITRPKGKIPKVAIIREEGSNGDREMAAALHMVGFEVTDICMNDFILNEDLTLEQFKGIVFVGGFSYSDVFGSANGWFNVIDSNQRIRKEFNKFFYREDTFSLGICNGCQLMARLNWIPECSLEPNNSGRFESRYVRVRVNHTNAIMLQGMEESELGVWVAHGEGRFLIRDDNGLENMPISYIDPDGFIAEDYPFNPNGSLFGLAGLCSKDGRHLAMMPHPERSIITWQNPVHPELLPKIYNKENDIEFTPWIMMFKNAYDWCLNQ